MTAPDPVPGGASAEDTGDGRFQVRIATGGISLLADEPVESGGAGSGPTPYELLCSALAACTTMTLRLYAEQKGWPVERVHTQVGHRREPGATPADVFTRHIWISGALDAAQRTRLLEIADRCPVHRTLTGGARVETLAGNAPPPCEQPTAHAVDMEALIAVGRPSFDFTGSACRRAPREARNRRRPHRQSPPDRSPRTRRSPSARPRADRRSRSDRRCTARIPPPHQPKSRR